MNDPACRSRTCLPGLLLAGAVAAVPAVAEEPARVTVDNYVRAQTDHQFADMARRAGGVNRWTHALAPTPIDAQPVIRMNRDTLYSSVLVDASRGATLTLPDFGRRYVSAMVIDRDHYIERVFSTPGTHSIEREAFGSDHLLVVVRLFVDAGDPKDVAAVNALQRALRIHARSDRPFEAQRWDEASRKRVQQGLAVAGQGLPNANRFFGSRSRVDPIRHLVGTASGWGGLPETEAVYQSVNPGLPTGRYRIDVPAQVPVDAFWSVSLYDANGYFAHNERGAYNVNTVTAKRNADGGTTLHFGGCEDGRANCLPIMDGWNYTVRLYRPRPEVIEGRWTFPAVRPAD